MNDSLIYLKKNYIPRSVYSGYLTQPCLRRIMHVPEDEGLSYAVQFHVKNMDRLNYWLENEAISINQELISRFGNKVTGFTTLLEEIDWEE